MLNVKKISIIVASCAVTLSVNAEAQGVNRGVRVRSVADTLPGGVGGVAVDRMGTIYVADFGDKVFKVTPDGRVSVFATGLYGTSGNAIDSRGNLIQSSFFGNYISKINRNGESEFLADGLNGPVGIAIDPDDNMVVCNCSNNSLTRVSREGVVSEFVTSDLLNCPNGITRAADGNYYVVNFSDTKVLKVTPEGAISELAELPGGGNGHIAFTRGFLYATSFQGQRIYRVSLEGDVELFAGTGAIGENNGAADQATFTFPNGIAVGPTGDRLYVNDFINRFPPTIETPPARLSSLRQITLASISSLLTQALQQGGVDEMVRAYRSWKNDPATGGVFTEIEVNAMGYQLMSGGQMPAALELFKLNTESYPQSFNVYDSLAEAYMRSGQNELAIEFYEKSLEINPANQNAVVMLERIRGSGNN